MPPAFRLISFTGLPGAGKTAMTSLMADVWNCQAFYEPVGSSNPWLPDLYEERASKIWLPAQMTYLSREMEDAAWLRKRGGLAVSDQVGTVMPLVHWPLAQRLGVASRQDLDTIVRMNAAIAHHRMTPSVLVHLSLSVETAMLRIARRGSPGEAEVPRSYWAALASGYEGFLHSYKDAPILTIDSESLDLADPELPEHITREVQKTLTARDDAPDISLAIAPAMPATNGASPRRQATPGQTAPSQPVHGQATPGTEAV